MVKLKYYMKEEYWCFNILAYLNIAMNVIGHVNLLLS